MEELFGVACHCVATCWGLVGCGKFSNRLPTLESHDTRWKILKLGGSGGVGEGGEMGGGCFDGRFKKKYKFIQKMIIITAFIFLGVRAIFGKKKWG